MSWEVRKKMSEWEEVLAKRRKEMELAVYFARQLVEEVGKERALEILGRAFERYLTDYLSKALQGVPVEKRFEKWCERLRQSAQEFPWFEVVACSGREVAVKITRCASYEVFAENGLGEVCRRYCDADFPTAKAIHPDLRLVRDKALANGDECCNHRYVLEG